jgi:hypothetical protein
MPDETQFQPEPTQVVSDLGQLMAFNDPFKIHLLRILQREHATIDHLASLTGEVADSVSVHIRALLSLGLIRHVGREASGGDIYRATARIYDLQPEPKDTALVMAPVASATLDAVRQDVVASLDAWPNQLMNFESRRLRMSHARAMEFNDKLIELLGDYWGNPDHPVEEDPDEPVMAFAGIWYRFPDKSED